MPTQNTFGLPLAMPSLVPSSSAIGVVNMTATDNAVAAVGIAEGGHGAIVALQIVVTAVTNPPTTRASIQGVSTRGTPDGSVKGSGTAKCDFTPSVGVMTLTLDSPYTPSANELLAFTVQYQSGTVGASNRSTIAQRTTSAGTMIGLPYSAAQTAGSWAANATGPACVAPVYADGTIGRGYCPLASLSNVLPTNASNPLYYGTLFTPVVGMVTSGAFVVVRPAASGSSFTLSLFEGANTTPVASATINPDSASSASSIVSAIYVPLTSYTLTAGAAYRWVISMTTGTAFTAFNVISCPNQASLQSFWGALLGTSGSSGSLTWTDFASGSDWRAYPVIPCIDSIVGGSAGGLLVCQGMNGGFDQ